jgi:hypothetical protein
MSKKNRASARAKKCSWPKREITKVVKFDVLRNGKERWKEVALRV